MATEARIDRPYTLDDLNEKFRQRGYAKSGVEEVDRNIKIEEGKLKSLREDRVRQEAILHDIEVQIKDMSKNLEK